MGMIINPANDIIKISSLNKGLVGHWPLDKQSLRGSLGLADKTPYSNHGVSANTPVFATDRMGQADRAMSFDGEIDYINCGNDASLNITEAITISLWLNVNEMLPAGSAMRPIISKGEIEDAAYSCSFVTNNTLDIRINNITNNFSFTEDQVWHHLVVTYDKTNIITYLDNTLKNTVGHTSSMQITANDLYIGADSTLANSRFLDGSIADIRIYNRALLETEKTSLYETYRPKILVG